MTKCCVVNCGATNAKNRQKLTFHRFPKNECLKRQWLEAVGEEKLNPKHKIWRICSQHFQDSCFNKTLTVVRLRDDSVPSIFSSSAYKKESTGLLEISNNTNSDDLTSLGTLPHRLAGNPQQSNKAVQVVSRKHKLETVFLEMKQIENLEDLTATDPFPYLLREKPQQRNETVSNQQKVDNLEDLTALGPLPHLLEDKPQQRNEAVQVVIETGKEKFLQSKCLKQQQKIKRLNEMLRRNKKKICDMAEIIRDLKNKNKIHGEQAELI